MPEICFYEPWTYQLALPEKFEKILEETKKKRISYEADHCSQYNTRTQGKSAKLHPPTLSAVLKLIAMQEQKEPEAGAAGIQDVENSIRYFCMEYPLDEEVCVMTYNFRNGRILWDQKEKRSGRRRYNQNARGFKRRLHRGGIPRHACLCKYCF